MPAGRASRRNRWRGHANGTGARPIRRHAVRDEWMACPNAREAGFGRHETSDPKRSGRTALPDGAMTRDARCEMTTIATRPVLPAVVIRQVNPADAPALCEFYAGLSSESRRRRFLGSTSPIGREGSCALCAVDHTHAEGLVALAAGGGDDGRLVGHLCLEPDGLGGVEIAVAVADRSQGQGIGRRLFEAAIAWARDHGIDRLTATALADNARVLRLLSSAPRGTIERWAGGGLVEIEIPIVSGRPAGASRRRPQPVPVAADSAWRGSS